MFLGTDIPSTSRISGLVVEYVVAIDVTRVRFPADALFTAAKKTESLSILAS